MGETDRPQSPFAGMADLSARTPVRVLSPDEIERMLAEHRLYLETEYYQGHRANFSSADLTGGDFSGLNLRRIKCLPLKTSRGSGPRSRLPRRAAVRPGADFNQRVGKLLQLGLALTE
jgi:hypothetical protein